MPKEKTLSVEREQLPFTIIENPAIDDERLNQSDLLVYLALCRHANAARECWPSYATLAREARCHRSTAIDAVKRLVKLRYVQKAKRRDGAGDMTSCMYRVRALTQPKEGVVVQDDHLVAPDDHGSRPGRPGVVVQDDPNYIHPEPDSGKGEEQPPSLTPLFSTQEAYQGLVEQLRRVNAGLIISPTSRAALSDLLMIESADVITAAYLRHQAKYPGKGINLFLADFGIWKAKSPAQAKDLGPECKYCGLHGDLHTESCGRPRNRAGPLSDSSGLHTTGNELQMGRIQG